MEAPPLLSSLFSLYLGTVTVPGKKRPHPQTDAPVGNCSPGSLRLRLRMIKFFIKSTLAANSFPSAVQVRGQGLKFRVQRLRFRVQKTVRH